MRPRSSAPSIARSSITSSASVVTYPARLCIDTAIGCAMSITN